MLDERYWFEGLSHACQSRHSVEQVASALYRARDPRTAELLEHLPLEKLPDGARAGIENQLSVIRWLQRLRQQAH